MRGVIALLAAFAVIGLCVGKSMVPPAEGYVATPGGWRHSSCLHELPKGHRVVERQDKSVVFEEIATGKITKEVPECNTPTLVNPGDGWQAWTWDQRSSPWTSFNGTFSIPDLPYASGQLLYAFTGLQDSCCGLGQCTNATQQADYSHQASVEMTGPDGKTRTYLVQAPDCNIIQPVLQYGAGPAGGGSYWSITNWFILGLRNIYTPCVQVHAGNSVLGTMNIMANGTWDIGFTEVQTGTYANLPISTFQVPSQYVAYCTIETYSVESQCQEYPERPVVFSGMTGALSGQTTKFDWTPTRAYFDCEQVATVMPNGDVSIAW